MAAARLDPRLQIRQVMARVKLCITDGAFLSADGYFLRFLSMYSSTYYSSTLVLLCQIAPSTLSSRPLCAVFLRARVWREREIDPDPITASLEDE